MLSIPALCWLCRMPLALPVQGLCSCCTRALLKHPSCCPRCGQPALSGRQPCGRCLQRPPLWQSLVQVGRYCTPLSTLVHQLKFTRNPALATPLARLMLLSVLQARRERGLQLPDAIIEVPLHQHRQWRRGFNQSALLAAPLARWLGCRYKSGAITRVRKGAIQHRLTAVQRARNLQKAFRLEFPVKGLHIALVDDIVTTGSTAAAIARLLHQGGIASLQVWCLCRTL